MSLRKVQTASSSKESLNPPLNFSADRVLSAINALISLEATKAVLPKTTMPLILNAPTTITPNPFSTVQDAEPALKKSMSTSPPTFSSNAWAKTTSTTIQTAPFTKRKRILSAVNSVLPHPGQL
jgi:hypothetical protein